MWPVSFKVINSKINKPGNPTPNDNFMSYITFVLPLYLSADLVSKFSTDRWHAGSRPNAQRPHALMRPEIVSRFLGCDIPMALAPFVLVSSS